MPQTAPTPHLRAFTIGLLASIVGVAFQNMAVATAMPRAAEDLGQIGLFGWAFSLFVIGMAVTTVVGGRLCDRMGPIVPAAIGMAAFVGGLVLAALAQSMLVLVAGRFVQGLGGGLLNVSTMVLVARVYDERQRATMMTAFSFCWVFPAFVGPPIAAWLTDHFGWHSVFWCVVPLLLGSALLCARPMLALSDRLGGLHHEDSDPVPVWSAVVAAVGLGGLQAGLQRLDGIGGGLVLAGLVCLGMSLPRLMVPRFFTVAPGLAATSWARMLQAGAFFAAEAFMPLALIQLRGLSLFRAGMILTIGSVGWTVSSWLQSRPWLRLRRDQIIILGAASSAIGIGLVTATTIWGWWLYTYAIAWTFAGFGMGFATASGSLVVMQLSKPHHLGRNTSSLQVSESVGNAALVGAAGTVFAVLHPHHLPPTTFAWLFSLILVAAVLSILAARRIGPVRNITSGVG